MKRILIVDDEDMIVDVLGRMLGRLGHSFAAADSGNAGIRRFLEGVYDLVLLDVLLPDIDGFQIAKEMRKHHADQRIVMVTGLSRETVYGRMRAEGIFVDGVLAKPFTVDHVASLVQSMG